MGAIASEHLTEGERRAVERYRALLASRRGIDVSFDEALADWAGNHSARWREARQADFLARQREEILKHKWIESEKAHRDLGSEAVMDWIAKYAAAWRDWYERECDTPLPFEMDKAC